MKTETYIQYLRNSNRQTNRIHQFNRHIYSWNLHKFRHAWTAAMELRAIYNAVFILTTNSMAGQTTLSPPLPRRISSQYLLIGNYAFTSICKMQKFSMNSNFHFEEFVWPFNWEFYSVLHQFAWIIRILIYIYYSENCSYELKQ